ncbi:hypothetical protein GCM10010520_51170 [Rhizobium viscosum]
MDMDTAATSGNNSVKSLPIGEKAANHKLFTHADVTIARKLMCETGTGGKVS